MIASNPVWLNLEHTVFITHILFWRRRRHLHYLPTVPTNNQSNSSFVRLMKNPTIVPKNKFEKIKPSKLEFNSGKVLWWSKQQQCWLVLGCGLARNNSEKKMEPSHHHHHHRKTHNYIQIQILFICNRIDFCSTVVCLSTRTQRRRDCRREFGRPFRAVGDRQWSKFGRCTCVCYSIIRLFYFVHAVSLPRRACHRHRGLNWRYIRRRSSHCCAHITSLNGINIDFESGGWWQPTNDGVDMEHNLAFQGQQWRAYTRDPFLFIGSKHTYNVKCVCDDDLESAQ